MKLKILAFVCFLFVGTVPGAEKGSTGLGAYLLQPLSAEYIALGNPYSLPLSSPAAIFYNPAGLGEIDRATFQCNYNFIPEIFDQSVWNIAFTFPLSASGFYPAIGIISHRISDIDFYNEEMEYLGNYFVNDLAFFGGIAKKSFAYNLGFSLFYSVSSTPGYEYEDISFWGGRFGMSLKVFKNVKANFVYFGTSSLQRKSSWNDSTIIESSNELVSASISFNYEGLFNSKFSFSGVLEIEHQNYRPYYFNGGFSVGYRFFRSYWIRMNIGLNHLNIDSDKACKYFDRYSSRMAYGVSLGLGSRMVLSYSILQEIIGFTHQVGVTFRL